MPEDASGRPTADTAGWRPVTRSLTYQLVVEAVEAQILTGALKVGDHLPPERELATLLGASRPAVREGMRMLEAQGVLRAVGAGPGSGTVVTALPSEALTRLLRLDRLDHELIGERARDRPPTGGVRRGSTGGIFGHTV